MSKTTIIIISITLVVLVVAGATGYFLLKPSSTQKTALPTPRPLDTMETTSETSELTGDVTYEDASGFSFKHPKLLTVTDTTPSDTTYYTQVSVANGQEKLVISVKDTKSKSISEWLKTKEAPSGASLTGEVTMAGLSSEQYSTTDRIFTVAIDSGVLYLIESPKSAEWDKIHTIVITSFAFAGSSSSSGASDTIYEEEEIVE